MVCDRVHRLFASKLVCGLIPLAFFCAMPAVASGFAVGEKRESTDGTDQVLAMRRIGNDVYQVSSFVRGVKCGVTSSRCDHDTVDVAGPVGGLRILASDMVLADAAISPEGNPVAVVLIPHEDEGYVTMYARAFIFVGKKPLQVLSTDAALVSNVEGPACLAKRLCAQSKIAVSFVPDAAAGQPGLTLRQSGTRVTRGGNGLENFETTTQYVFDPSKTRYVKRQ